MQPKTRRRRRFGQVEEKKRKAGQSKRKIIPESSRCSRKSL